ncbi:ATP/GTP-binding protein [Variovorax sp. KK3]|uniref:GTP-binding protein n=1 Tax=Variovorax sp. KK3 TaxID=1855728 RepID=UPI00097BFF79|nr:GTPase [Variovorax sp. KK3]
MTPRIVLFGPMGIGKTTAIRSLCGDALSSCEVPNLAATMEAKPTTTVGAEFGVVRLPSSDEELHVYGSPGQDRFGFLRRWLLGFAAGVLVLVDVREPDALGHAMSIVTQAAALDPSPAVAVLAARAVDRSQLEQFSRTLAEQAGMAVPVLEIDVRDRAQMLDALELLVAVLPD